MVPLAKGTMTAFSPKPFDLWMVMMRMASWPSGVVMLNLSLFSSHHLRKASSDGPCRLQNSSTVSRKALRKLISRRAAGGNISIRLSTIS